MEAAGRFGYDFSRITPKYNQTSIIQFILYRKNLLFDTPFFKEIITGVEKVFKNTRYRVMIFNLKSEENVRSN